MTDQSSDKPRVTAGTHHTANEKSHFSPGNGKQPGAAAGGSGASSSSANDSALGLQKRLSDQEMRVRKLDAEFSRRLGEAKDAELALVSRIGDVDDDRRQDSARLQRSFQAQYEELGGRIDRTRGLLVTLLIVSGLVAAAVLGFLYYEVSKSRHSLSADLAEQRQQLSGLGERVADTQRLSEQLVSDVRETREAGANGRQADAQPVVDAERLERMQIANREQLEQLQVAYDRQLERLQASSEDQLKRLNQSIEALQRKIDELQMQQRQVDSALVAALAGSGPVKPTPDADATPDEGGDELRPIDATAQPRAQAPDLDATDAADAAFADRLSATESEAEDGQGEPASLAMTTSAPEQESAHDSADEPAADNAPATELQTELMEASAHDEASSESEEDRDDETSAETADNPPQAMPERAARAEPPTPQQIRQRPYTVQLMGFYTKKLLRHYLNEHAEVPSDAVYLQRTRKGRPWYVLIHSFHKTGQSARQAAESLPESLASPNVWVQPIQPDAKLYKLPD